MAWEVDEWSAVSYVLSIQEKLANMVELVKGNMEKAQETQKRWYDLNARDRSFEVGEKILVLLPTSTNKLLAQWQGPYEVVKKVNKVIYHAGGDAEQVEKTPKLPHQYAAQVARTTGNQLLHGRGKG